MAAKTKIPKSRAKTAYGLLSEIVALIRDEPRRLDMSMPLDTNAKDAYELAPSCGTVGCVAGWAVMLRGNPNAKIPITTQGADILGIPNAVADLFYVFPKSSRDDNKPETLTRHAAEEIKIIRAFQKTNRKQLLAKTF